jgi:hypothetical protein
MLKTFFILFLVPFSLLADRPCFVVSIPHSGTHLIAKLLEMATGKQHFSDKNLAYFNKNYGQYQQELGYSLD